MLEDRIEKWYRRYGRKVILILSVILCAYMILRLKILSLFAPFIIAWLFATLLNRVVTWAHQRLKISRGIGTIISMLTILSGILSILILVFRKLWEQIVNFSTRMPGITDEIIGQIGVMEGRISEMLRLQPGSGALQNLDTLVQQLMDGFSNFLSSAIPVAYGAVSKVPDLLLFIVAMLLATFFMTKDYYRIKDFVKAQFSDTIVDKIVIMQRGVIEAIGGYIRTQVILMSLTFMICLVGLVIFDTDYALLLAVIIAIVDALPVFGSGTILIPWSLYNLLTGHLTLGVGLLGIYGIIFMTRQILEPKILSSQIGMYALVTVMAVYAGYKLMGFIGLILGPVIVVVLQMLQNVGALPPFKPIHKQEGDHHEKYTGSSHS